MTFPNLQLGYLVVATRKPAAWAAFCQDTLGLPRPVRNTDGSWGWRVDGASQRLVVTEAPHDDLLATGLDCGSAAGLQDAARRLRAAGFEAEAAAPALASARRVDHLLVARDPAGNAVELFAGLQQAVEPFRSEAFPGGFVTGDLGLGHAVLVHDDLPALEAFYVDGLGFGVTERLQTRAGPIEVHGTFLHCNRRHHSLALFRLPSRKRLHHFMLEARDAVDVARAMDRARANKVPLSLSLGQHPDPDGTFSFYGSTPSGFDFEIGAGSGLIDPQGWRTERTAVTSSWGHHVQWPLKLRMAGALLAGRMGRGRTRLPAASHAAATRPAGQR